MRTHLIAAALIGCAVVAGTALADDGDSQRGKQLYSAKMCNLCHTLAGESGPMAQVGGPLDGLAAKRDAAWMNAYLKDPTKVIPNAQMPKTELTDQEIADLTAYLLSR